MSDRYVEKSFVWLLALSLLLHLGALALVICLPPAKEPPPKEPVFIDLQQMPELKVPPTPSQQEVPRLSDRRIRVERERAPKGQAARDSAATVAPAPRPRQMPPRAPQATAQGAAPAGRQRMPVPAERRDYQVPAGSSAASLLKPRQPAGRLGETQLFPGASRMAKLEESYRRKFESDIAEGDTKFLNTDDIQFGSFLRRFENSVYGVWRYPQEAARNGIEGITPVKITFNRRGEITHVQLLESSGSRLLDDEVFRTLKAIGPVGSFPKGYDKEEFHLIAFFQYGISRRALR